VAGEVFSADSEQKPLKVIKGELSAGSGKVAIAPISSSVPGGGINCLTSPCCVHTNRGDLPGRNLEFLEVS
jgi:hypothetical protein